MLLAVSGMLLTDTTQDAVISNAQELFPSSVAEPVTERRRRAEAGLRLGRLRCAIVGLLGAVWTASGYVGAFIRAANSIYDVPEGRPIWKILPIRLGVTVVVGVLIALAAMSIVFTGKFAEQVGGRIGLAKQRCRSGTSPSGRSC